MFITLEGIDGSGKTTQVELLKEWKLAQEQNWLFTCQPGKGISLRAFRDLSVSGKSLTSDSEMLLFFIDRIEHIAREIKPAIDAGRTVFCDRYNDSTYAYQVAGLNDNHPRVKRLFEQLTHTLALPTPDITILIDLEPKIAQARRITRGGCDVIESRSLEFHQRVRQGYLKLADHERRFIIVDGALPIRQVNEIIVAELEQRLNRDNALPVINR